MNTKISVENKGKVKLVSKLTVKEIEELKTEIEPIQKIAMHDDADGISSAVLMSLVFNVNRIFCPLDFGQFPIEDYVLNNQKEVAPDVCVDMVPANPEWRGTCFSGDTEVFFEDKCNQHLNVMQFDKIVDNRKVKVYYDKTKVDGVKVSYDKCRLVTLHLKNGEEIRCTPNHLFPTPNGLKQASELKGEFLYLSETPIETTDLGSRELGEFLGLMFTSTNKNRFTFQIKCKESIDKIQSFLTFIGVKSIVTKVHDSYSITFKSSIVNNMLKKYFGVTEEGFKFFKTPVYNLSLTARQGLLDVLFVKHGRQARRCISFNNKVSRDSVRNLCVSLGLTTSIRYYSLQNNYPEYRLSFGKQNRCFKTFNNRLCVEVLDVDNSDTKLYRTHCFKLENDDKLFILANGIQVHNCLDHHVHPLIQDRRYTLYHSTVPAGLMIYKLFQDVIPDEEKWKVVVSCVGDMAPELIPLEIWRSFPILLEETVATWEKWGKLETSNFPLYLRLASGINSLAKWGPDKAYIAYGILKKAKSPLDLIENSTLKSAKDSLLEEKKRIYSDFTPLQLRNGIRLWDFKSDSKLERTLAWELWDKDKKTTIAINSSSGRGSIRGVLSLLVYEHLNKYGFKANGHPGAGGLKLKPTQTVHDLYMCLSKLSI